MQYSVRFERARLCHAHALVEADTPEQAEERALNALTDGDWQDGGLLDDIAVVEVALTDPVGSVRGTVPCATVAHAAERGGDRCASR